jgi:hypothetical protein
MKHSPITVTLLFCAGALGGCQPNAGATRREQNATAEALKCTDFGASYTGFAGERLDDGRVKANIGADRSRVKPYSALRAEYERVLGVAPNGIDQAAPSFGAPPSRFSVEPRASAIQLYSAYRLAFDGCLSYVETLPELADEPTPQAASTMCSAMARRFWSRAPTESEVDHCAQVALVDSAPEPVPQRRWAYTCAALLSSAGFLTY